MSASPSLFSYLVRDSLLRWRGRWSVPLSRLAVAVSLSTAALLVLASFALGGATLRARIARFGLDSFVVRTPLRRVSDPAPRFPALADYGRVLVLRVPYATAQLDHGGSAALAAADETTLPALVALGVESTRLPLLLTSSLPPGMPLRGGLGPWNAEAQTARIPPALQPLALGEMLVIRPGDFPMQANLPGTALTLFVRSPNAPPLEKIVAAVEAVIAANASTRETAATVQSALPLLREMAALEASWLRYAALLALVLAATIAVVFGSGAILEYETTAFTTALLRSFGVRCLTLWLQRYLEAAALANIGGALALAASIGVSRLALPQLEPQLFAAAAIMPVLLALNVGAFCATIPVAKALRRPVGMVLQ